MAVFGANEATPNLKEMTQNLWNEVSSKSSKYDAMQCDGDALRFKCNAQNFALSYDDSIRLRGIQIALKASDNQIKIESEGFMFFSNEVLRGLSQDERDILPYKITDEQKITKDKETITIQEETFIRSKDDSNMKIEYEVELKLAPFKDKNLLQLSAIVYQWLISEDFIKTNDDSIYANREEMTREFEQLKKQLLINIKAIKITLDSQTLKNVLYQKYLKDFKDSQAANIQQYESDIGFGIQMGLAGMFGARTPLPENFARASLEFAKSSVTFLSPNSKQSKIGIEMKSKNPPSLTLLDLYQMNQRQFFDFVSKYEIKILP